MGTEGHFDQESLQTLREVMEEEFVELFELFIKDSSQRLQRIELAVEQLDSEALCAEVHSLKGSSGNICAIHLSALAKD
ncbi:MAG: Hpt domain-containing protein, partial [Oceanobacter sp.]